MTDNGSVIIHYVRGGADDLGGGKPKAESWAKFKKLFHKAFTTPETQSVFVKKSEDDQKALKRLAGWIFRSQVDGKRRNAMSAKPSEILTFDFDYPSVEFYEAVRDGRAGIPWPYFIHTTRRHHPLKPRFRLILLLAHAVPNDLYGAVSRIAATHFDPDLTNVDKVSFRSAQMMFLPTVSVDQEYVFAEHDGVPLDWEEMLDAWEVLTGQDPKDISKLPRAPDETELRTPAEKAENPLEKEGIVGIFCRAWPSMTEVIDAFDLPYEPSEEGRYTYSGATSTNGVVIYDDLFLYSHHGSDPYSERLLNVFDAVMLHTFGEYAENEGKNTPMAHRKSFKAMQELIKKDDRCKQEQIITSFDLDFMFDGLADEEQAEIVEAEEQGAIGAALPGLAGPYNRDAGTDLKVIALTGDAKPFRIDQARRRPRAPTTWLNELDLTQQGVPKSTAYNLGQIIGHDPRFRDSIGFNEFLNDAVALRPIKTKLDWIPSFPVRDTLNGEPWQDKHDAVLRTILSAPNGPGKIGWGINNPANQDIGAGLRLAAHSNAFHPVRETLESLKHDGVARADYLLVRWLGTPNTPYYREIARLFLIAAVARIYEPGSKFDYAPVLFGAQGVRKSTFIRILALHWFGELTAKFDDEQALAGQMAGCWIMELAELASMAKAQVEDVKVFMSALQTKVRLAYDRRVTSFPRQCVFMGSTNNLDFLKDETGNRRFWPVEVMVDSIDTDEFAKVVPQIWAEALLLYRQMRAAHPHGDLPLMLSEAAQRTALQLQEQSRRKSEADTLAEVFQPMLDAPDPAKGKGQFSAAMIRKKSVTVLEMRMIARDNGFNVNGQGANLVVAALKLCGWVNSKNRPRIDGGQTTAYVPGPQVLRRWEREDQPDWSDVI